MKNGVIGFVFLAASVSAHAEPSPQSRQEYCTKARTKGYFTHLAFDRQNRIAFDNWHGGILNKGLCWWHALFQRASLYLTVYRPDLPKPNAKQAEAIIHSIAAGRHVVEIPGYANLYEFSKDWETPIKKKLEQWQLVDGVLKFAWISALRGDSEVQPAELAGRLGEFNALRSDGEIHWIMWRSEGTRRHGTLLLDMKKTRNGFDIVHLDNNYNSQESHIEYTSGMRSLGGYFGPTVPYQGRESDLRGFRQAAQEYCRGSRSGAAYHEPLSNHAK